MNLSQLVNQSRFTVLLGKNGSGKSTRLRELSHSARAKFKYISPERGGTLVYEPGVDQAIAQDENWIFKTRMKNRTENFRQQSAAQFRILEMLILREIEQDLSKRNDYSYKFDTILNEINELLPAIRLVRSDKGFRVENRTGEKIQEDTLSSGESELIALAIEVLVFSRYGESDKILLLDEPDVHLHPDLQQRFIGFVEKSATEHNYRVVIATHSTAIIGSFSRNADLQIVPVSDSKQTGFASFKGEEVSSAILPIFGAHPLSSMFNKSPVVLVEGDDDKRVMEQVVRSGNGRFSFNPCPVGSVDEMSRWENWLNQFLPVIYDQPKAFSLRDLDQSAQSEIDNVGCVSRCRLNCYSIENVLLTDECFQFNNLDSTRFLSALTGWATQNANHQRIAIVQDLINRYEVRRTIKIKDIRNIILSLLDSSKPWEVIVGQVIALHIDSSGGGADALSTYLGAKASRELFGRKVTG